MPWSQRNGTSFPCCFKIVFAFSEMLQCIGANTRKTVVQCGKSRLYHYFALRTEHEYAYRRARARVNLCLFAVLWAVRADDGIQTAYVFLRNNRAKTFYDYSFKQIKCEIWFARHMLSRNMHRLFWWSLAVAYVRFFAKKNHENAVSIICRIFCVFVVSSCLCHSHPNDTKQKQQKKSERCGKQCDHIVRMTPVATCVPARYA